MEAKLDQGYIVTLSDQAVPEYSLLQPLAVLVEQDEQGMFLASDSVTTVYGYGKTGQQALVDYLTSLVEYYEMLEESEESRTVSAFNLLRMYLIKHTV